MHIYQPPSIYMHIYLYKYAKNRGIVDIYMHISQICIYIDPPRYICIFIYANMLNIEVWSIYMHISQICIYIEGGRYICIYKYAYISTPLDIYAYLYMQIC